MSTPKPNPGSTIVLKFGGSVLKGADPYPAIVREIYRYHREGWRVLAVVSAKEGRTDQLLAAHPALPSGTDAGTAAARVAIGEAESAAELGGALAASGVPVSVLSPAAVSFVASTERGDELTATPRSIEPRAIERAFDRGEVVVLPGYTAVDEDARTVLLGRGGSDLTAIWLAAQWRRRIPDELAVRCRLIKDVDGLFASDPARPGPPPERYYRCHFDDALATDGSIVQHAAVRWAERLGVSFEIAALGSGRATIVSDESSVTATEPPAASPVPTVLFGAGPVGCAIAAELLREPSIDLRAVVVRDAETAREGIPTDLITDDLDAALAIDDLALWIDATSGEEPASTAIARAKARGVAVVTANKEAAASSANIAKSATVGGATPILETIEGIVARTRGTIDTVQLRGVLNGTANFLLDAVSAGEPFTDALARAQGLGLAERDPHADLSGLDAARKLSLIARAWGVPLDPQKVARSPITALDISPPPRGTRLRQVSHLELIGGRLESARVTLDAIPHDDPLATIDGAWNGVSIVVRTADGGEQEFTLRGVGAGPRPTALAVLGDVGECVRQLRRATRPHETLEEVSR